jgi:hypothetical protein
MCSDLDCRGGDEVLHRHAPSVLYAQAWRPVEERSSLPKFRVHFPIFKGQFGFVVDFAARAITRPLSVELSAPYALDAVP